MVIIDSDKQEEGELQGEQEEVHRSSLGTSPSLAVSLYGREVVKTVEAGAEVDKKPEIQPHPQDRGT